MTKLILAIAAALIIVWCYGFVHATPPAVTPVPERQERSKVFCDGLSLPQERQCPLMSDL